jgi:2-methylisocitrate lyase-like PEP mutase family enzyme
LKNLRNNQIIGFDVAFMTGFGVSATYGVPDAGLVSAGEMYQAGATVCSVLKTTPCVGDGDTVS